MHCYIKHDVIILEGFRIRKGKRLLFNKNTTFIIDMHHIFYKIEYILL